MNTPGMPCDRVELLVPYLFGTMQANEAAALEAHTTECQACRRELGRLRPVVESLIAWPTDLLRPSESLRERLASRIAAETGGESVWSPGSEWEEPDWEEITPGIFCKVLATDLERDRVTMLVRLVPGASYPAHIHAGVEELHLLHGELWIDDRLLRPGDYSYGPAGASDLRVHSETGCTCVLITSPSDVLI